jgi:hypothetical protein
LAEAKRDGVLQTPSRLESVTRVFGTLREGNARDRLKSARPTFARTIPIRNLPCPRKWNTMRASHREQAAAHRLSMRQRIAWANATGIR